MITASFAAHVESRATALIKTPQLALAAMFKNVGQEGDYIILSDTPDVSDSQVPLVQASVQFQFADEPLLLQQDADESVANFLTHVVNMVVMLSSSPYLLTRILADEEE